MVNETILQHWIFTRFAFPFLLVFFIVFAILEKTKIFGDDKKQLNALIAFVIGLAFVTFTHPTEVVNNLILFLTIALVAMFVVLLLWGFVTGGEAKISNEYVKWGAGILIVIGVVIALLYLLGYYDEAVNYLFGKAWSSTIWVNVVFVIVIAAALAAVIKGSK